MFDDQQKLIVMLNTLLIFVTSWLKLLLVQLFSAGILFHEKTHYVFDLTVNKYIIFISFIEKQDTIEFMIIQETHNFYKLLFWFCFIFK